MRTEIFETAADRIAFSEAVDFLEQGRGQLIPDQLVQKYVGKGLWRRDGSRLRLTEEGLRQHQLAMRERFSDG
jgi:hypothetical protein